MSIENDPTVKLQHYPTPMRRFGANLYGDPLYRIVLASSVMHLVGGQWPDGTRAYRWVPKYRNPRAAWILESWSVPRISKREWESFTDPISGWPILGPYPSRGEYELSWEFDKGVDADNLDMIIGAIEKGRTRSFQDVRDFAAKEYAQERAAERSAANAEIRDSYTAFGILPKAISSLSGVSRGTKTLPEMRSANELGLPIPGAAPKVGNRSGERRTFDVRDAEVTSTFISR